MGGRSNDGVWMLVCQRDGKAVSTSSIVRARRGFPILRLLYSQEGVIHVTNFATLQAERQLCGHGVIMPPRWKKTVLFVIVGAGFLYLGGGYRANCRYYSRFWAPLLALQLSCADAKGVRNELNCDRRRPS